MYLEELVEVRESWAGHHGYQKRNQKKIIISYCILGLLCHPCNSAVPNRIVLPDMIIVYCCCFQGNPWVSCAYILFQEVLGWLVVLQDSAHLCLH